MGVRGIPGENGVIKQEEERVLRWGCLTVSHAAGSSDSGATETCLLDLTTKMLVTVKEHSFTQRCMCMQKPDCGRLKSE